MARRARFVVVALLVIGGGACGVEGGLLGEGDFSYRGLLQKIRVSNSDDPAQMHLLLADDEGMRWQLLFSAGTSRAEAEEWVGLRVGVEGVASDDGQLQVDRMEPLEHPADRLSIAASSAPQQRTVAFVITDMPGMTLDTSCSADVLAGHMYNRNPRAQHALWADRYMELVSEGALRFTSDLDGDGQLDIFGPYRVAREGNYASWANEATRKAQAAGIDLRPYHHVVFIVPPRATDGWAGLGTLDSPIGQPRGQGAVWAAICVPKILIHELGHNLGLHHSNTDQQNNGNSIEYGDTSCVMGSGNAAFNAIHQQNLGWIAAEQIREVTESGTLTIYPLEQSSATVPGLKLVRIPIPQTHPTEYYYLSLRANLYPIRNRLMDVPAAYLGGVNVHRSEGPARIARTHFIRRLSQSSPVFNDSATQITVRSLQVSAEKATVAVVLGGTVTATPPQINEQPGSQTVREGARAAFTVAASGSGLTYQWQRNGTDIHRANGPSYTTPLTQTTDNGARYRCQVRNAGGTVLSNEATLTVTALPPQITGQPQSQTVREGARATFIVAASGSGLTYQWQRNGTAIHGATAPSYTTPAIQTTDSGARYRCQVRNAGGTVLSNEATLTVTPVTVRSCYQNPQNPLDVDGDGQVTARDVLILSNELNANGPRALPTTCPSSPRYYWDVNGDGHLTPADALIIVNYLNAQ